MNCQYAGEASIQRRRQLGYWQWPPLGRGSLSRRIPEPGSQTHMEPAPKRAQCSPGLKECKETFTDQGQIDLKGRLQAVLRDGYQGTMSLECEYQASGPQSHANHGALAGGVAKSDVLGSVVEDTCDREIVRPFPIPGEGISRQPLRSATKSLTSSSPTETRTRSGVMPIFN